MKPQIETAPSGGGTPARSLTTTTDKESVMADAQPTVPTLAALREARAEALEHQREMEREGHKVGRAYSIGYGHALDRIIGMLEGGK